MIARFITLVLIAVLALPVATLPRPADPNPSPWGEVVLASKGKKHKKAKHKRPPTPTVPRTVRQIETRTFSSSEPITIPAGAPATDKGLANLYPTAIEVSGFSNGVITDVNLVLSDLTHGYPDDLDILLSASDDRRALVLSDVGANHAVTNIDLTLDDEAVTDLPDNAAASSGTYRPTNRDSGVVGDDSFAAPAPGLDGNVALSTFDGANPNGTWQLWVLDDGTGDSGSLGGWTLQITAETDVQVDAPEKAKAKQHKKQGKKRR